MVADKTVMAVILGTGVVTAARVGKAFVLRKSRHVAQRIRVNTGRKEGGVQSAHQFEVKKPIQVPVVSITELMG
jgi:hypothetical protein